MKTTDYSQFKHFEGNRPVGRRQVKNLMESISKNNLTEANPIIVNCNMEIIDGQHRFEACKELGLPIYYNMLPSTTDSESAMVSLNQVQVSWRQEEFLNYWAQKKGGCWKQLNDFYRAHMTFGISNTIVIFPDKGLDSANIKRGDTTFGKNPKCDKIYDWIMSNAVSGTVNYSKNRNFVVAVKNAFEIYSDRQMQKIAKYVICIPKQASQEQYLAAFENIIKR